jgi:hypothetical protein
MGFSGIFGIGLAGELTAEVNKENCASVPAVQGRLPPVFSRACSKTNRVLEQAQKSFRFFRRPVAAYDIDAFHSIWYQQSNMIQGKGFLKISSKIATLGTVFAFSIISLNNSLTSSQKLPGIHFLWIYRFFYFVGGHLTQGDKL